MPAAIKLIRLSANAAAVELRVTTDKIKRGLKANGIKPGEDNKYSLKDIFTALSPRSGLEQKASEARFHRQIEEAAIAKIERQERRDLLAPIEKLTAYGADLVTTHVTFLRHCSLPQKERDQAIALLKSIEFTPGKTTGKNGHG